MYGALPWLQNLKGLEEKICEQEGFKVMIWVWQTTKGRRTGVSYNCCLSLYL